MGVTAGASAGASSLLQSIAHLQQLAWMYMSKAQPAAFSEQVSPHSCRILGRWAGMGIRQLLAQWHW